MADSPHVADVGRADFPEGVIARSHQVPVLVDFWAPWCGPCRMLTPVLTKLADEYGGKVFLAKVNTDVEQDLAMEYGIRGIPAVKLFRDGKVAEEFVGVQPESMVRALIEKFLPRETDTVVERAISLARTGNTSEAIELLRDAVVRDPQNEKAAIELVRLLSASPQGPDLKQRVEEAERFLNSLRAGTNPEIDALRARLDLLRVVADAPPLEELKTILQTNPNDLEARYRLAARLALKGKYEDAMEEFLELVRRDRKFADDAGRKGLLTVFALLGNKDPRVSQYRTVLSRALN
jgi:putative thioredoxin